MVLRSATLMFPCTLTTGIHLSSNLSLNPMDTSMPDLNHPPQEYLPHLSSRRLVYPLRQFCHKCKASYCILRPPETPRICGPFPGQICYPLMRYPSIQGAGTRSCHIAGSAARVGSLQKMLPFASCLVGT